MTERERWRALGPLVVAGKPVAAGETFTAPAATLVVALAHGMVEPAKAPRRRADA